jgi:SAM-dependent methyltransferase
MAIYRDYAPFYDGSGQIRFALLMAQYLAELFERHPPRADGRAGRALDLACGTGTLAVALAEQGWRVTGLDRSAEMVAQARAKAEAAGVARRTRFGLADMRAPPSAVRPASFDLVTCTYDSLNYLLAEPDLERCFSAAARALRPGGLFFGDMNTRHFLEHDWPACEVEERPGFVQITRSWFDPETATSTMRLTGFSGDDRSGYRRIEETHVERAYPPELVAALFERAGMPAEASYDCFTFQPVHPRSQRIAWVARKPAGERR